MQVSWKDILEPYQEYRKFLRGDSARFILVIILTLVIAASNTALIWFIGEPFSLLQQARYDEIARAITWCAVFVTSSIILTYINAFLANGIALDFVGRIRQAVLKKVFAVSFPLLNRYSKGDILVRLSQDIDKVLNLVVELPLAIAGNLFAVVLYLCMLIMIDWQMTLIAAMFLPLFYLQQRYFATRKHTAATRFMQNNAKLLAFEEQGISNLKNISAYSLEKRMLERQKEQFNNARNWLFRSRMIDISLSTLLTATVYACAIILIFIGITRVENGLLQTGTLISLLLYIAYLSAPVRAFSMLPLQLRESLAAIERVNDVLELSTNASQNKNAIELEQCEGRISFEHLTFAFDNDKPVFDDVNLALPGSQTVAFVGLSGSGKSTLIDLLLRQFQPVEGQILIDGKKINDISLSSLRKQMTLVTPQPFLLDTSIRENLLLARQDADEEQLKRACEQAQAWEFISHFDDGLDTLLGENGVNLSTGQSQRLCLARAFLRDTPVLILDEATSSVDSQSEQKILAALTQHRAGRTTIIIAHRYSAIQSAALIVYFNKDGSIATGQHNDLYDSHAGYRQAFKLQSNLEPGQTTAELIEAG